uniref:Astacin domain-containing protein n=1 Tax=Strongyloides venezuelensis TaxID=75913 RepID=A0A0K0EY47_STRVS
MKITLIILLLCSLHITESLTKKKVFKEYKKILPLKKPPPYLEKSGYLFISYPKKYEDNILNIFHNISTFTCLQYKVEKNRINDKIGINFYVTKKVIKVKRSYKLNKPTNVYLKNYVYKNITKLSFYAGLALELIPEVTRRDRRKYVSINFRNIKNSFKKYYMRTKYNYTYRQNEEFDIESTMLNDPYLGTIDKTPTYKIKIHKKFLKTFNTSKLFSFSNFRRIHDLYCREKCNLTDYCENGSFPNPSCTHCICSPYFVGKKCEKLKPSEGYCGVQEEFWVIKKVNFLSNDNIEGKCYYSFKTKEEKRIKIIIEHLIFRNNNCTIDDPYMQIFYGRDKSTPDLTICNNVTNLNITSLSNEVYIYFHIPTVPNKLYLKFHEIN